MRLQPSSQLLFIGDSITDCRRGRPIGASDRSGSLGNGYVSLVSAALSCVYPDYVIKIFNTGVSGDTVRDLKFRWERDVIAHKPNWLSVMIGINDVWGQFSLLGSFGKKISENEFGDTLAELIQQARPNLQGLVLMTPYYLETDRQEPLRSMMDRYGELVKKAAQNEDAILVDTQAYFDRVFNFTDPLQLAEDRVHVNLTGHMILARAFLDGINFNWEHMPDEENN